MSRLFTPKNVHISFHISLILKGLFDIVELFGGILFIFLTPEKMNRLIRFISANELREDPNDFIMRHLISFSKTFSMNTQLTATIYLLSHATIKLIIIIFLWKKKLWIYPASCVIFTIFIVIQMIDFTQTHSITLLLVTIVDLIMIILTILEYKNMKRSAIT